MDLKLTYQDKQSSLYAKLIRVTEKEIHRLRKSNDAKSLNEVETAYIRGRIAELNSLLRDLDRKEN